MKTLLWLDDYRDPGNVTWLIQFAPDWCNNIENIFWVKTYYEFCVWIEHNGLPHTIAFDHDLSDFQAFKNGFPDIMEDVPWPETEKTGMDCAKWCCEYCMDNKLTFPEYVVQSANPVGTENIISYIENFKKHIR